MKGNRKLILLIIALLILSVIFFSVRKKIKSYTGKPGDVVELTFELDKKFEFGEYYFDLANGKGSTYPLCYCLTEKNTYPPDCYGDVKYLYNNTPGTMCMPLNIGTGQCSAKVMSSSGHATMFIIPLEYSWTKPFEKIVIGIRIPVKAPEEAKLVVAVTIFKRIEAGKLIIYRKYEQAIIVKNPKG
ncbi:MAG: hypothetical protein ABI707_15780 [Ferruginibacter sp.]